MATKVRKTRWGWRIALLLIPAAAWVGWLQIPRLGWSTTPTGAGVVGGAVPGTNWRWAASAAFGVVAWTGDENIMTSLPDGATYCCPAGKFADFLYVAVIAQPSLPRFGVAWAYGVERCCIHASWWLLLTLTHLAAAPLLIALMRSTLSLGGRQGRRISRPHWILCGLPAIAPAVWLLLILAGVTVHAGLNGQRLRVESAGVIVEHVGFGHGFSCRCEPSSRRRLSLKQPAFPWNDAFPVFTSSPTSSPDDWRYQGWSLTPNGFALASWIIGLGMLVLTAPLLDAWRRRRIRAYRSLASCCAYCGYPFAGLPEQRCPECGARPDARDLPRRPGRLWPRLMWLLIPAAAWCANHWLHASGAAVSSAQPIARGAAFWESWILVGDVPDIDLYQVSQHTVERMEREGLTPGRWEDEHAPVYPWDEGGVMSADTYALDGMQQIAACDWLWVTWAGGRKFLALHTTFLLTLAHLAVLPLLLWLWRRRRLRVWRRLIEDDMENAGMTTSS